jgi:hypothetical protein
MNNRRLCVSLLVVAIVAGSASAGEESIYGPDRTSVVKEAGRAVTDRVFGVQGMAGEIDYHVVELTHHSPTSSAIRSAFVPGWGQGYNRQRVKGAILFATFAALTYGAVDQYNASKDSYDAYQARGLQNDVLYDDYESEKTRSLILGTAAVGLWVFAIVDAYRNAYNPLWSKADGVQLVVSAEGGNVVWKKSFGQP